MANLFFKNVKETLSWRGKLLCECIFYRCMLRNWRTVINARLKGGVFDMFLLRNGKVITFEAQPPWDIFRDIWMKKVYDRNYKTYPKKYPAIVVDIGANIGIFSLIFILMEKRRKILLLK